MKKIVHIMICAWYKEGFSYQENILPLKHQELGLDVHIITYNQGGEASYTAVGNPPITYTNSNGIPVHILLKRSNVFLDKIIPQLFMLQTCGLYEKLEELQPDIIFVHGIPGLDHLLVTKYVKNHPHVRLYADNHADYYNTPFNNLYGTIRHKILGRYIARKMALRGRMLWGVSPWRVHSLQHIYGVPAHKVQLLVMGGDEKKILWNKKDEIRTVIRKKYNIPHDAFLIITGGKIDKAKNIHTLTQVVKKLQHLNIYLLVFGRFEADMNPYIDCFHGNNIVVTGWIESEKAYDLFLASDLAVFPGTHSVLWEQSCASGLPGIFKKWDNGFDHIDIGGNCILLDNVSEDSLFRAILELHNTDGYKHMKHIAETIAREKFSYMSIAKRAIEYSTYEGKQ